MAVICLLLAFALAINDCEGWGWFIFLALVLD